MNRFTQILCLCLFFSSFVQGQFNDNFDDGDFTNNPTWAGDVDKFIVNDDLRLQLNDTESGSSVLYTPYSITEDFTWAIDLVMDFDPSNNNRLECYFMVDNSDLSIANGFYFSIGENLSEDNLKIFKLIDGVPSTEPIAEGELGALAKKPATLKLRMERVAGDWSVFTSYDVNSVETFELAFSDDFLDDITDAFWVLNPNYTSSNATRFTFDNISATNYVPDTFAPKVTSFSAGNGNQVFMVYDEALDINAIDENNFGLDPNIAIDLIEFPSESDNEIILSFAENFSSALSYTLTVTDIPDLNGNVSDAESFTVEVAELVEKGDVVINEILFDPLAGGSDYVEIKNVSDKLLNLDGLRIANFDKDEANPVPEGIFLRANQIVAFSEDTSLTISTYKPQDYKLVEMNLPSFNKDMGNVSAVNKDGITLDSFDYTEDMHLSLLDDSKGVSLERIFTSSPTVEENFTSGVARTNYGTPGYENANSKEGITELEDVLTVENDVFSPNGDGQDDQLIMFLNFPDNGYYSTIDIFNIQGQKVRTLVSNQITAPRDIVRWDGTLDDGSKAYIGHYIVVMKAFREEGETLYAKKHIKLLDFF